MSEYITPVMLTDSTGYIIDTALDIGFILMDIYFLATDEGYKDWKNWAALGADIILAAIPFVTGGGQVVKLANVADDLGDLSKVTVIGETMGRVKTVSQFVNGTDNLYGGFRAYDKLHDSGRFLGKISAEIGGKGSNAIWLYSKLRSGYKIVDIGIDSSRVCNKTGRLARSSSYMLERGMISIWRTRNVWKSVYHFD